MAGRREWTEKQWKSYRDEGQQGRKRAGRHQDGPHERSPGRDSWNRRWEARHEEGDREAQKRDAELMPPPGPRGEPGQPSSSCSGATSANQVLLLADERVTDSETVEQIRAKLMQVRLATSRLPPRDHAWKTMKREELRLLDSLARQHDAPRTAEEQAELLQKEYHEQCITTMTLWEKRQKLAEEAKTAQINLDAAERAYTCSVITKEMVGARLHTLYEQGAKEQQRQMRALQAKALRDLTPRGVNTQRPPTVPIVVGTPEGTTPPTTLYPRSQMTPRGQGSVAVATQALPKCPVLAKMPTVASAITSWTEVQQAAREMAAVTRATEQSSADNPFSVESIRLEVDEAVRLAQRAKECLGGAITRAGVRLHAAQIADTPPVTLTPRRASSAEEPPVGDGGESCRSAGEQAVVPTGSIAGTQGVVEVVDDDIAVA